MTQKHTVLRSINLPGETQCVDIFERNDGTFGFEEFRRDVEDDRGWFPIGFHGGQVFGSESDALAAAKTAVAWLDEALEG